jgi:hypothetical protein
MEFHGYGATPRQDSGFHRGQSEYFPEYIGKTPQHFTGGAEIIFCRPPPSPAPNARSAPIHARPTLCAFVTYYVTNGAGRSASAASDRRFHRYSDCLGVSDTRPFVFSPHFFGGSRPPISTRSRRDKRLLAAKYPSAPTVSN